MEEEKDKKIHILY